MDTLEFSKGHGTGNDFVILPDPEGRLALTPKLVAALCDRRFGIGADGVLRVVRTVAAASQPGSGVDERRLGAAEWFMDYHNADGSVAEMCGNGARVFARYLVETGLAGAGPGQTGAAGTGELTLGTRAGPVVAVVSPDAVSVSMGLPRVYGESTARIGGVELAGVAVDCGNPHLVCAVPAGLDLAGLDLIRAPVVDSRVFPDGVNVEFAAPASGDSPAAVGHQVRMRVHERGVGETLSCGSGACAVAAMVLRDAGVSSGVVTVDVPGGRLTVSLSDTECVLAGPAVLVAHGTVDVAVLC